MSEEIYSTRSRSYISQSDIRAMQKKALKSYKQINTIQQLAEKERQKSIDIAEKELEQFIDNWNQKSNNTPMNII